MRISDAISLAVEDNDLPFEEKLDAIEEGMVTLANSGVEPAENTNLFRHVILVEVVTDREVDLGRWSLADVEAEFINGDFSGKVTYAASQEVSVEDMNVLLIRQGSDPAFFGMLEE